MAPLAFLLLPRAHLVPLAAAALVCAVAWVHGLLRAQLPAQLVLRGRTPRLKAQRALLLACLALQAPFVAPLAFQLLQPALSVPLAAAALVFAAVWDHGLLRALRSVQLVQWEHTLQLKAQPAPHPVWPVLRDRSAWRA